MLESTSLKITRESRTFPYQIIEGYRYRKLSEAKRAVDLIGYSIPRKELVVRKNKAPEVRRNICKTCHKLTKPGSAVFVKRTGIFPTWNSLCRCA